MICLHFKMQTELQLQTFACRDGCTDWRTDRGNNNIREISLDCTDIIVDNQLWGNVKQIKNNYLTIFPWCRGIALISHEVDRSSITGRYRPKSLKQVVKAPLPKSRQQVLVSRVLGDEYYKGFARVTVGLARYRCLTALWQSKLSMGQNLQPFTGNGDVS